MIKYWDKFVKIDKNSREQIEMTAELPIIYKNIAVMPDAHYGKGCCVGAVIPTIKAVIPACVGVDIGCGMVASKLNITANDLTEKILRQIKDKVQKTIPMGFKRGGHPTIPDRVKDIWDGNLGQTFEREINKTGMFDKTNNVKHLGTLGSGNHFIELCLDESDDVWIMLHSGSRGVGNAIGRYYIQKAQEHILSKNISLPSPDLSYLEEGTQVFKDYVIAVKWAQEFAEINRDLMAAIFLNAINEFFNFPVGYTIHGINCHHNYIDFSYKDESGNPIYLSRKGAISARKDEWGIIPGSMGVKSYIVKGLGNLEAWESSSHGAGRTLSRTQAKKLYTLDDFEEQTEGVMCDKNPKLIDEIPAAYKNIDDVMSSQKELTQPIHTLKQVLCMKGI